MPLPKPWLTEMLPAPVKVRSAIPGNVMAPATVSVLPTVPEPMVAFPTTVIAPTVPLPLTLLRAPMPPAPVPVMVRGSAARLMPPSSWSVPPEETIVPLAVPPSEFAFETSRMPALTVVRPV